MREERRVVDFIAWSTGLFFAISILVALLDVSWLPFDRINLVSDVVKKNSHSPPAPAPNRKTDTVSAQVTSPRPFEQYLLPARVIGFHPDTNRYSLPRFLARLHSLQTTKKGKLRIAYFGDSMIEGDLITQTLRQLLQQQFGGSGVGYVPITSIVAKFRQTIRAEYSNGWTDRNFKSNPDRSALYLSGHAFISQADSARYTDATVSDKVRVLDKILLCGPGENASIVVNGNERPLAASNSFNRLVLSSDASRTIHLTANSSTPTLYGVSFETPSGIVVDNFSFRGITGVELEKLSADWLSSIQQKQPYDLIVFQYGVNLLFRPNTTDFRSYGKAMLPVIERFKQRFPTADILIVSTADRAFRYEGKYASAIGIDSLVRVQAKVAFDAQVAFYNQFATMGGTNSIIEWANRTPSWAGRDYVHPNARGADWLGQTFYGVLLQEYDRYLRSLKNKQTQSSRP